MAQSPFRSCFRAAEGPVVSLCRHFPEKNWALTPDFVIHKHLRRGVVLPTPEGLG